MRARRMPWPVVLLVVLGGIVLPAAPAAAFPINTEPPALARDGRSLTTTSGSWLLDQGTYAYRWESCDADEANCFTVPGRTANRYLLTTADVGRRIRSLVLATNPLGTTVAKSAATQAVAASPPSNLTPPTVTADGSTLSSTLGTWSDPSPDSVAYTRRWQRCPQADGLNCQDVAGQSGVTFTPNAADELKFIRVVVSAEGLGRTSVASALFGPIPATPTPARPDPGPGPGAGGPKDPAPGKAKPRKLRPFPKVIIAGRLIRGRTLVSGLVVRAGPEGSTVTVSCRGRGCPRGGTFRARLSRKGTLQLKRFQRMYGAGAVIEIRITSPGAIGKFTRVQIRPRGVPSRRDACLMPGKSKPARCP